MAMIERARMIAAPDYFLLALPLALGQRTVPPHAAGPIPSPSQLAWQQLEYYAFIHFGMNVHRSRMGRGASSTYSLYATQLTAWQWARVAKEAGMRNHHHCASTTMDSALRPSTTTIQLGLSMARWQGRRPEELSEKPAANMD